MAWREDVIKMLRVDRADLLERLAPLESGQMQMLHVRDGEQFDVTGDEITRMKISISEIEHMLFDAGASLDA